jgi:hypothetical protein
VVLGWRRVGALAIGRRAVEGIGEGEREGGPLRRGGGRWRAGWGGSAGRNKIVRRKMNVFFRDDITTWLKQSLKMIFTVTEMIAGWVKQHS